MHPSSGSDPAPDPLHTASALDADRRSGHRRRHAGVLTVLWHHRPTHPVRLETLDVSETGARILTTCCLPEGLTGTAIEIEGLGEGDDEDLRVPELRCMDRSARREPAHRLPIGRAVMVVWTRAVRRDDGRVDHHEVGLRFF